MNWISTKKLLPGVTVGNVIVRAITPKNQTLYYTGFYEKGWHIIYGNDDIDIQEITHWLEPDTII